MKKILHVLGVIIAVITIITPLTIKDIVINDYCYYIEFFNNTGYVIEK